VMLRTEPAQALNPLKFRSNQIQPLKLTQVQSVQVQLKCCPGQVQINFLFLAQPIQGPGICERAFSSSKETDDLGLGQAWAQVGGSLANVEVLPPV